MSDTLPTRLFDIIVRTVDRVKDRSGIVGMGFFALGLAGCLITPWSLPTALIFYGFWAGHRICELWSKTRTASQKADERLAKSIETAMRKLIEEHHGAVIDGKAERPEPVKSPRIAPPPRT